MNARADLHVHRKYSNRPSEWLLRRIGAPECFVELSRVYKQARAKGRERHSMHIVLATETYFPQINGVSRALGNLVEHLCHSGDTVTILMPRYQEGAPNLPAGAVCTDFAAVRCPFYRELYIPMTRPSQIRKILQDLQPDLVHIATEALLGWSALQAVRQLCLPMVSSYHTNFCQYTRYYRIGWLEKRLWSYLRRFHNHGRITFCPTRSIAELLEQNGFTNVAIWARGVDCRSFNPKHRDQSIRAQYGIGDGDVLLLNVGRLAHEKNVPLLLEAFHRLRTKRKARLMLVGDGPSRSQLQQRYGDTIIFTGYKRDHELAQLYAAADLFVFPSITDTFGNVILEAMASGVPVVGFDAPGPRDIIQPGQTGLVLADSSAQGLADALGRLIDNPKQRRQMGTAARAYAEQQSWAAINQVVRNAYQQVLQ